MRVLLNDDRLENPSLSQKYDLLKEIKKLFFGLSESTLCSAYKHEFVKRMTVVVTRGSLESLRKEPFYL